MALSNRRPWSEVPGLNVRDEHVVLRDTQINKSSRNFRSGFFELTDFEVLSYLGDSLAVDDFTHISSSLPSRMVSFQS